MMARQKSMRQDWRYDKPTDKPWQGAPTPVSMQIPAGEWNIFVSGTQLARYTGPAELVFSVSFVLPLTEEEKAVNVAGG